jgi:hypothetical protein
LSILVDFGPFFQTQHYKNTTVLSPWFIPDLADLPPFENPKIEAVSSKRARASGSLLTTLSKVPGGLSTPTSSPAISRRAPPDKDLA